ncbi:MAG TPA: aldo/keto reductase [Burkholderiales bacterium]|nr:aldo/keto reductase [Burkholderiales bacterium]
MLRRAIPRSGESLPVVGLGTYQTFDVGDDRAAREPLREVLRALVEHGGSVIDSSPMYGSSEAVVGELCAELELRPRLFLATKVWTSGRDAGVRQMEQSLRRMRAESLDLMQIHNLVDWRTHARTLREWKQAGRIRYAGVTHYHSGAYDELERVMKTRQFDFVQLNYSIAEREAEETLLPLAQELGMAVIANRPFAQASLFSRVQGRPLPSWAAEFDCGSWAQFFLKYILAHPAVTCVIPATSKPKHMLDNLMAGYGKLPDEKARRRMTQFLSGL